MRITLSPVINFAFIILLIGIIHIYAYPTLQFINSKIPIYIQFMMLAGVLFLVSIGSKLFKKKGTGNSVQLSNKENYFWRSLTIEISVKGILRLISFLIRIFIFSLCLYYSVHFLVIAFIGFYKGEAIFLGRGAGIFILVPISIIVFALMYFGSKSYFKKK